MNLLSVLLAILLQASSTAQEPRRVAPTQSSIPKPVYRDVQKGEARVEGLLQRVECPAGRPVTFVVKLKDRVEKYEADRLGDVEYIAYTPDFKGPMSCGGRASGDPVLLTWKTVGKARRVVAVEFLPRPATDKVP
jgi:hypothetical protein